MSGEQVERRGEIDERATSVGETSAEASAETEAPPLPLLVTGVAGVAGYNAFGYLRQRYGDQVIGLRRVDNWPLARPGVESCDTHDPVGLQRLFDKYGFRSVLHCEGTCKLKSCELDPAMARRINIDSTLNLLDRLGPDVRLVALSVDLVYSGVRSGGHVEDDPPDPVTVYGATMAEAERWILGRRPDACVIRISLPMGVSFNGHAGAIDWIQSRFKKDKPATLYYDEIRTPTYTDCLNRLFETLLSRPIGGLYHAGGPRRLSLFEIAQIVNRIGGYDPRHLQGCLRQAAGPIPPRAGDVSLNSDRLTAVLGASPFDPWPLLDAWTPTDRRWHFDRPADEERSPERLAEVLYRNPKRSPRDRSTARSTDSGGPA